MLGALQAGSKSHAADRAAEVIAAAALLMLRVRHGAFAARRSLRSYNRTVTYRADIGWVDRFINSIRCRRLVGVELCCQSPGGTATRRLDCRDAVVSARFKS